MNSGILYISYDGMLEPLGQSQVLAYLEKLATDRPIHLLSFEKSEDWADSDLRNRVTDRIHKAGIIWHPKRYHKKPTALATSFDLAVGIATGLWLILRYRLRIVHARSYVPAVMALALKKITGVKFLFDMRGFWADERVDGNLWPRDGRMYKIAKWFEQRFLLNADHVVSLTHAAISEIWDFDYIKNGRMPIITVIPTCADLSRFKPLPIEKEGFTLGYVGSAGTWYLFDKTVACFAKVLAIKPDTRFLIINRGEHEYIKACLAEAGIPIDHVELRSANIHEMPALIARMHASIFFIKPVFSKQASAPTKLAELLGCGIPCLGNASVGDMANILEGEHVGIALQDFDEATLEKAAERLLALLNEPGISERCVATAKKHFSLDEGVTRYNAIYKSLLEGA